MFNTICFHLNRVPGLSYGVAALRLVLAAVCLPWLRAWQYEQPAAVGYAGGLNAPGLGTLAFTRRDGSLQWRW